MGSGGPNGFHDSALVRAPGVVLGRSGASFGQAHYCRNDFWPHNTALYVTDFFGNHPLFAFYFLNAIDFSRHNSGGAQQSLNRNFIAPIQIAVPKRKEQDAIAEALSDADALIECLEQLLAKKSQLKQGAMQELVTGKKRLPGFSGEWEVKYIAEIASPTTLRNASGEKLPVLTCSKHLGFVDSLGFFKNQVFSKDLSTYKVIRRGEIGYPANHVEEGSIGLQNLYDMALVSPIYVVFAVAENTNSFFLHRLLKLDSYRLKFKAATTSSVERRGSLRWSAFSEITVRLPSLTEQTAIAAILSDMDAEIAALQAKLAKARQLKLGMMQELLTGRIRLV
jgi:type I restriction enzyme, S subunit